MMKKYRVKQEGNKYKIQQRVLFIWFNLIIDIEGDGYYIPCKYFSKKYAEGVVELFNNK